MAEILLVEDSLLQAKMIQMTLEEEGYNVQVSENGANLTQRLIDEKIDVLLLDVILPDADGFELLGYVLANPDTMDIPTIMVTGLTSGGDVKKALDMGAFDYVKKPIEPIEIVARVNAALRLKAKQDLLKQFSIRDTVTSLYNRSYFDKKIRETVENAASYEKGVSLAIMGFDSFKIVNEKYGHTAGDAILSALASVVSKTSRDSDIVCRYGGAEFYMILLNRTLEESVGVCEKIRKNVGKTRFLFVDTEIVVTVSIGVAHLPPHRRMSPKKLISLTDKALNIAKSGGGNKVSSIRE